HFPATVPAPPPLHAALPICPPLAVPPEGPRPGQNGLGPLVRKAAHGPDRLEVRTVEELIPVEVRRVPGVDLERDREGPEHRLRRSEEHTSELQSRENLVCRL